MTPVAITGIEGLLRYGVHEAVAKSFRHANDFSIG